MATVDVLIPTCDRKTGLAIVLTSLLGQTYEDFDVVISDQSDPDRDDYLDAIEIRTLVRVLERRGHRVTRLKRWPRRGMAEQRQFLLDQATAPYVHFLDDDVVLEPEVMSRMLDVIRRERCGFVGCPAAGTDFLDDVRPHQQAIELWEGPVVPELFAPGAIPWDRHPVNRAANPLHVGDRLVPPGEVLRYKVAWVGGANVLYDRRKLLDVGGFSWWDRLPVAHAGEDALAQFMLIRYHGGCGILPAATYHLCLPTNVPDRSTEATHLFGDLIAEQEAADTLAHTS